MIRLHDVVEVLDLPHFNLQEQSAIKNITKSLPEELTKELDCLGQEYLNLNLALAYIFGFLNGRIDDLTKNGSKPKLS